MKKLVYKNIAGNNPRKREISIEEVHDWADPEEELSCSNHTMVMKKRIYKYFLREKYVSNAPEKLRDWVQRKKEITTCHKNCHILRKVDAITGENKIVCKVLGCFFVISGNAAYKIVYINEIKIQLYEA